MKSEPRGVIITSLDLLPGKEDDFSKWKAEHDRAILKFPGFGSGDIMAPVGDGNRKWTLIANFDSPANLERWTLSEERRRIVEQVSTLCKEGKVVDTTKFVEEADGHEGSVTEVIFSKVKSGLEDEYLEWAAKIQAAESKFPGYQGMFCQPGREHGDFWITILRFSDAMSLERWINSPERRALLAEAADLLDNEKHVRLSTSFPGWVPVNPVTGESPPNWKTGLLVLLGLFPLVVLTVKFLVPLWASHLPGAASTFVGNIVTVAGTTFVTMPVFIRWFGWWLFPKTRGIRTDLLGLLLLLVIFAIQIALLQLLYR